MYLVIFHSREIHPSYTPPEQWLFQYVDLRFDKGKCCTIAVIGVFTLVRGEDMMLVGEFLVLGSILDATLWDCFWA